MNKKGAVLAGRILAELKEFSILIERIELGMQKAKTQNLFEKQSKILFRHLKTIW